jgi:hypothetical protein
VVIEQYGIQGTRKINLLSSYGFTPGSEWRVKIRAVFPNNVHGDYGSDEQCLRIAGSIAAAPVIDETHDEFNELGEIKMQVYPNPSNSGLIHLYHPQWEENLVSIEIFDAMGRKVFENRYFEPNIIQESLAHLSNGVYTIQMKWGAESEKMHWLLQK